MKKSQIRTLAILAAVALLLGVFLAVLRYEKAPEVLPALVEIPTDQVDQLVFTSNTANINLQLQNGQWQVLLPESGLALPARENVVNTMLQQLSQVRPQQELKDADPELFAASVLQATIDLLSGSDAGQITASQQIRIYAMNAITDQLYVQLGDHYYLTDTSLMRIFPASQLELLEQYPIPKPENHERVTVENALGSITLSCVGSETGGEDGVWFVQTADGWVEADQNAAYNFYFLTWDMHWKSTAAVITDSSALSSYDLENPQATYTLTYGGETFQLYFGTNLPDNTTYAMCAGSPLLYTMDTLLVQWLTQATPEALLPAA